MAIPAGYAQANLIFTGLDVPTGAECTMGLNLAGFIIENPVVIANAVMSCWNDSTLPSQLSSGCSMSRVDVKIGPDATGPSGSSTTAGAAGTGAAPGNPSTSLLVTKATLFGGRAGKGRFYLPAPQALGLETDGRVKTTYGNGVQDDLNSFFGKLDAAELAPVVFHGPNSPLDDPTPITGFVLSRRVGNQRRRNRR